MEFNELIAAFAMRYNVEGLEPQNGTIALEIDGMNVGFLHDSPSGNGIDDGIMVIIEIGYAPPDVDGPFGTVMLKANYLLGGTGGAILCQNPDTNAYSIMHLFSLAMLDLESFSQELESMLTTAENWKDMLAGIRVAEEAKEALDAQAARIAKAARDAKKQNDSDIITEDFPPGNFLKV